MEPGRELDALIAEKVMGCKLVRKNGLLVASKNFEEFKYYRNHHDFWCECENKEHQQTDEYGIGYWLKEYSTDIKAAWEIVEKINADSKYSRSMWMSRDLISNATKPHEWLYTVWFRKDSADNGVEYQEHSASAPHAICLAALKAKGIEV